MFTTGAIGADCAVNALFAIDTQAVGTSVVTGSGTVSPYAQTVSYGASATFALAPATGNHIDSASCCGRTLDRSIHVTSAVAADCTVTVSFALDQVAVSATVEGGHGDVAPETQLIAYGPDATFPLKPDRGYVVDARKGCLGGRGPTGCTCSIAS